MTIKEKAAAYDIALKVANKYKDTHIMFPSIKDEMFPELRESEDERIRNEIIAFVEQSIHRGGGTPIPEEQEIKWIAWLEAQNKKDNNEDADILQRFSFYSYKDEPSVLYLSNVFVNEEYRNKGIGTKILKTADEVSTYLKYNSIRLKTEKGSNAESLYRKNGYKTLKEEEGNQIWLEKQIEQKSSDKVESKDYNSIDPHFGKPVDKVEPKFKVGDWIVNNITKEIFKITELIDFGYESIDENGKTHTLFIDESDYHLWTIQDAKVGDVLVCKGNIKNSNGIKYERICLFNNLGNAFFTLTKTSNYVEEYDIDVNIDYPDNTAPATKEQKEILFMAMADAGYTFDFEKKELKKIEQKQVIDYPDNLPKDNWELVHEFVEKFGRIPEDEDELNALVEYVLNRQEYTWSEDDKEKLDRIISIIHCYTGTVQEEDELTNWLKSLKPQSNQEWTEEDSYMLGQAIKCVNNSGKLEVSTEEIEEWLKSLRPQKQWKPSEEQVNALDDVISSRNIKYDVLSELWKDLKKLRKE